MFKVEPGECGMNLAVFELFLCLLRAKQNEIKGLKETSRQGTNTRRQTEPYEQWNFQRS